MMRALAASSFDVRAWQARGAYRRAHGGMLRRLAAQREGV